MVAQIQRSFQNLERQKSELLSPLAEWSTARANFRPDPTCWSTLDVLDHLRKVENALVKSVQTNLPHHHPVTFKDKLGALMVNGVMRSPIRVKVPAAAAMVLPEATADLSTIAGQWKATRDELASLLNPLSPEHLCHGVFHHPVAGWMTLPQAMGFLSAHLKHHGYQLARLTHSSRGL